MIKSIAIERLWEKIQPRAESAFETLTKTRGCLYTFICTHHHSLHQKPGLSTWAWRGGKRGLKASFMKFSLAVRHGELGLVWEQVEWNPAGQGIVVLGSLVWVWKGDFVWKPGRKNWEPKKPRLREAASPGASSLGQDLACWVDPRQIDADW